MYSTTLAGAFGQGGSTPDGFGTLWVDGYCVPSSAYVFFFLAWVFWSFLQGVVAAHGEEDEE